MKNQKLVLCVGLMMVFRLLTINGLASNDKPDSGPIQDAKAEKKSPNPDMTWDQWVYYLTHILKIKL